jgi:RimJ/RimL family protein N-acetyltransferase
MFARTRRLTLRPGWPEDAPGVFAAIAHRAVVEKLANVPWPYQPHHADEWLARPDDGAHVMLIEAHDLGPVPRLVGAIGLHPDAEATLGEKYQIGYWLTPDAWGRGYATEAGRQVVSMARHALGLTRLAAYHHHDNPGSGRVLAKLGFREVGRGTRRSVARGEVDSVLLTLDLGAVAEPDLPLAA